MVEIQELATTNHKQSKRESEIEWRSSGNTAWWAVASRFLLHGLIVSTWVSRIPSIKSALHLNNATFGLCLLGTAIGSVLAVPVTGWLVTKVGSKRVTIWSSIGFSLALFGPSLVTSAAALFAGLLLFGAFAGANDVSINSQGVGLETALRIPTMSRFHAMFSIGGMMGAGLGVVVAAHGIAPAVHLGVAAIFFLCLSAVTGSALPDVRDVSGRRRSRSGTPRRVPAVLLILATLGFCMFLSEGAIADWSGIYLKQALSTPASVAAAGYAVFSAGMALFRLLGDSITRYFGPVRTLRGAALIAATGLLMALMANSAAWALPGFGLTGAGLSVIVPLVFGAGGRVNSVASSTGIAMVSGSGYIGFLFGPPLIGLVAQRTSLREALYILVGLTVLAAALAPAVRVSRQAE